MTSLSHPYAPRLRGERFIATGRVALAGGALGAILLDPTEPDTYATLALTILSGYLAYALALVVSVRASQVLPSLFSLITHCIDVAVFVVLVSFTEGPSSPFFVCFTFALVAATMRWHARGVLWTAGVAVSVFVAMGVYTFFVTHDQAFELNRFIIRAVYLGVSAVLLAYLGTHEALWRRDWIALSNVSSATADDLTDVLRTSLRGATEAVGAGRALLVWEESDEPWQFVAVRSDQGVVLSREPPATFEPYTASDLAQSVFGSKNIRRDADWLYVVGHQPRRVPPAGVVNDILVSRFGMRAVLTAPIASSHFWGRLFLLDSRDVSHDKVELTSFVAAQVTVAMNHYFLSRAREQASVLEERLRLAREIHDGPLQTFGGFAMQLEGIASQISHDPVAAHDRLRSVQKVILDEQRELRLALGQLRRLRTYQSEPFDVSLQRLGSRVQAIWGIEVAMAVHLPEGIANTHLARETSALVREALVNAARHARASQVQVDVRSADGSICITVTDNGGGFPFLGRYNYSELTAMRIGPVTIKERVAALGADLMIESSPKGSTLSIVVPTSVGRT